MKKITTLTLMLLPLFIMAQDGTVKALRSEAERTIKKEEDTTKRLWRKGGLYGINISQGSLSNWAAGGDIFSLSVNSLLNLYAFYKIYKHS